MTNFQYFIIDFMFLKDKIIFLLTLELCPKSIFKLLYVIDSIN